MPDPTGIKELLGPDLWALAVAAGPVPVHAEVLTVLPSDGSPRGSFRIEYDGGVVRKGRRMADKRVSRRVHDLRRLLDEDQLPRLHGVSGSAWLTDWVSGTAPDGADSGLCRLAGAVLGRVHATPVPAALANRYGFPSEHWMGRLDGNLQTLVSEGALAEGVAEHAQEMALSAWPQSMPRGLVHCDFCPENLVLTPDGTLLMVDNENMTVDAIPFDLARTVYRWPLEGPTADAFWGGYATVMDPAPFLNDRAFWMIQALAEAAAFRVAGRTAHPDVPLDALLAVVQDGRADRESA